VTQLVEVRRRGRDVGVGERLPRLAIHVTPRTVVMGASATRDWQPQHHDHKHCVEVANLPDIFLNTPHQAGIIQRYLTDWGGPHARLGRLAFRMKRSVVPGDRLDLDAQVTEVRDDDEVTWVALDLQLTVDGELATGCTAQLALPTDEGDNPWSRTGDAWQP
jgi:acyl dehydratase